MKANAIMSALGGLVLTVLVADAGAWTIDESSYKIGMLKKAIQASYFTNDRDMTKLALKADAADMKLKEAKFSDCIQKIGDIEFKVDGLLGAGKTKLDPDDAADIHEAAAEAISSIEGLMGD